MTVPAGVPMTATEIVARREEALDRIRRGFDGAAAIYLRPAWEAVMAASGTEPPPVPPAPNPAAKERHAEKDPKWMCRTGEHGRCGVEGCDCWCHLERVGKKEEEP